jgi:hypothetical protein
MSNGDQYQSIYEAYQGPYGHLEAIIAMVDLKRAGMS